MAIAAATGTRHPLDELDGDEVRAAAAAAREELLALGGDETSVVRFAAVTLKPPPKAEVKAWLATKGSSGSEQPPPERRAEVIATVLPAGNSYEVEVGGLSGSKGVVASLSKLSDGAQPLLSPDDCALAEEIVRADASVAALLREQYGIGSMDEIVAVRDPVGGIGPPMLEPDGASRRFSSMARARDLCTRAHFVLVVPRALGSDMAIVRAQH
mmetsp:Transcript_4506/g.18113  ORF Transcript_4506/g.18113 Transcript_4506/m.18113 type:complete len:213 (-) Transcript_4506:2008-2646(-)